MTQKRYKLVYTLYSYNYEELPHEISVVTENPWEYLERIKADLMMNRPDLQIGTYSISKITHLEVVK
jgi:hypothetical protein